MTEYRVLARKYRPTNFDDLVGQEVLVQTLSNAIARNRLAHAFLLTGIRGIGKTTTARIIAKALNCIGLDGQGGPTISPCGECANCVAITEDRHVDVLEMDAASRTGVDDIRDLIETVHYAPTNALYKVYIIDEVHMLSKSAFNALLKTLEEPPAHVKFVFATTELRKIPVTILSRCQRFDLKRLDNEQLSTHLADICAKEAVKADEKALMLIANAAEGSVRDGLSILDQAIAHAEEINGVLHVAATQVEQMLGLADKQRNVQLLDALLSARLPEAIEILQAQYAAGGDPVLILQDLLEIIHSLTTLKSGVVHDISDMLAQSDVGKKLCESLSITVLTRAWQMILKGIQEVQIAPNPLMAAEMVLVRIAHMADLPAPSELIRKLKGQKPQPNAAAVQSTALPPEPNPAPTLTAMEHVMAPTPTTSPVSKMSAGESVVAVASVPQSDVMAQPVSFDEVLALFQEHREMILYNHLDRDARLVSFQPGHIEVNFTDTVPSTVPGRIGQLLNDWTGERWMVVLSQQVGEDPRAQVRQQAKTVQFEQAKTAPLVAEVLQLFPGAELIDIEQGV